MMGDLCSCAGCQTEVVAWIDGGAWCGSHALRVLEGDSAVPEESVGADVMSRAPVLAKFGTSQRRFIAK